MRPLLILIVVFLFNCPTAVPADPLERWVYAPANFLLKAEVERIEALIEQAAELKYTHLLITDSKFCRLSEMQEPYFAHIARIRKFAESKSIRLVPAVFPVGYSNDLLSQNVHMAEGLPVRDAKFVVRNNVAQIEADPAVSLPAMTDRKKWGFIDETLKPDGDAITVTDPRGENCRAMTTVKVSPFRHYRVSVMVRTQDLDGQVEIKVLEPESSRRLNHTSLTVAATQDWSQQQITFNSLNNSTVNVYLGSWEPKAGQMSLQGAAIEECGLTNVLRRQGTPLVVRTGDKAPRELIEGTDFQLVVDNQLGTVPYPGEYEVWHESPPIRMKGDWPDGTELRVLWYHPHIIHDGQVCGCVTEPGFVKLLKNHANGVEMLFPDSDRMMNHDEFRLFGWDESFVKLKTTPGKVLADNARMCVDHLMALNANRRIAVWSDMFDPHHNAINSYYLVNGDLAGAWEGLDPSVIVMNWNFGKRAESLKFFADRGHSQIIAGYYDNGPKEITHWLKTVRDENVPHVVGVMYTTWHKDYSELASFKAAVDEWERATTR